jgi:hypothetical protein
VKRSSIAPRRVADVFDRVSEAEIRDCVRLPRRTDLPALTVVAGPCRSGTTALQRAAAATGHPSYFQPLKRLIRSAMVGQDAQFTLWPAAGPVVLKETFGPFVIGEVEFDPLGILRRCGYPISMLSLIITLRHPVDLFHSWQRLYGANGRFGAPSPDLFVAAFRHTLDVHQWARDSGHRVTAFAVDSLSNKEPESVLSTLFARHGLDYTSAAVDWTGASGGRLDELIIREPEPAVFRASGSLDGVRHATNYSLHGRQCGTLIRKVPDRVVELAVMYECFVAQCLNDLEGAP